MTFVLCLFIFIVYVAPRTCSVFSLLQSVSIEPENSAIEIEYMVSHAHTHTRAHVCACARILKNFINATVVNPQTTMLRPGSKYTKIALLKLHCKLSKHTCNIMIELI